MGARACDLPVTDTTCGAGRAHFVGGEGCEDVGAACPAEGERFAADLPAETIFVAPDATGDGTRANPFGTLADAFSVVTSGDVVALAAGDHEADALQLPNGVRLVGACAARTRVLGAVGADFAFGGGGGRSATLENLTIRQAAIAVGVAGEVTLRGVVIESIVGAGLAVTSTGRLRLEDVVVRDVEPAGTSGGMALLVDGGQVDGTRVILEDALRSALRVMGGRATFDRLRAWARPFGGLSRGVGAWVTGGEVTLRHVDLRGATNTAVEVSGDGVVALSDALANAIEEVDPPGVFALYAREGGRLTVDRAWVRGQGWLVHADDATVAVRDTILEGLPGGRLYAENVGVVSFSSPFELERVVVTGTNSGLLANGPFDFEIDPEAPPPPPADPIAFAIADLHLVDVGADVRFGYGVSLDVPFVGPIARVHGERIKGIALDSSGDVAFQDLRSVRAGRRRRRRRQSELRARARRPGRKRDPRACPRRRHLRGRDRRARRRSHAGRRHDSPRPRASLRRRHLPRSPRRHRARRVLRRDRARREPRGGRRRPLRRAARVRRRDRSDRRHDSRRDGGRVRAGRRLRRPAAGRRRALRGQRHERGDDVARGARSAASADALRPPRR
ncbi:MAG: DUF1565 domain-containing protein [Sandaracinus sp.]|nr:DUF1565 domain-containing protein [Sandaracinus sp.]